MPSGGARLNAGRRPKSLVVVRKVLAEQILGNVDELSLWRGLLSSEDEKIKLEALKYLTDRRDGKAPRKHGYGAGSGHCPREKDFHFHSTK